MYSTIQLAEVVSAAPGETCRDRELCSVLHWPAGRDAAPDSAAHTVGIIPLSDEFAALRNRPPLQPLGCSGAVIP